MACVGGDKLNANGSEPTNERTTLRQAALTGGVALLVMLFAAPFAELYVQPKLIVPGDASATLASMSAARGLFLAGLFAYFITFVCDILVAWAFYVYLAPVNRALSLLTAWFRLIYTVVAFAAMLKLVTVYRLLPGPDAPAGNGGSRLDAQVELLLASFRYEWGFGLLLFGIHLGLVGYLVYRAGYVPKFIGVLLLISALGYPAYYLSPFFYPGADVQWVMVTFFAEPVFMVWLLLRGWRIGRNPGQTGSGNQSTTSR